MLALLAIPEETGTTDEICRIMEQSDCTSNQHSAKNDRRESSLVTEDEDTSVPISDCNTADKGFQISFNGSSEVEAGGETSVPISNTDTIDKALQISLGSENDSSPAIVLRKAKTVRKKVALPKGLKPSKLFQIFLNLIRAELMHLSLISLRSSITFLSPYFLCPQFRGFPTTSSRSPRFHRPPMTRMSRKGETRMTTVASLSLLPRRCPRLPLLIGRPERRLHWETI